MNLANIDGAVLETETTMSEDYKNLDGDSYHYIANSHSMPEFWMSLVGAGDHWMFVASNGALTAGRQNPDLALFPYSADDQILAARHLTGSFTLVRLSADDGSGRSNCWEPFGARQDEPFRYRRNLYKSSLGTRVVFEEVNESLGLVFRYRWCFSQKFGFVRTCWLENTASESRKFELLDGLQNVLPHGIGQEFLTRYSNLANAYKKSELVGENGLGIFYLSSIPTDRAEPSEGLKANVVWQTGLNSNSTLLSSSQIEAFRRAESVGCESVVRGKPGAYLTNQTIQLEPGEVVSWHVVAELAQDHSDIIELKNWIAEQADPSAEIEKDLSASEMDFLRILSSSDAVQCGANRRRNDRHLSNTVFNVMRGGVPLENYLVHADDFGSFVKNSNRDVFEQHETFLAQLPSQVEVFELHERAESTSDPDLIRLSREYLPLAFSRRHGDPTRPWNRFSIDLKSENGRTNLNYQGNWRDIFQNWEALGFSFPKFLPSMICRFANATTADGYNPYRLTSRGFEWEEPAPDDPWANIGYWGDHQIIYLLKLLEWARRFEPQSLEKLLNCRSFVHANVPYRIREFEAIKSDPRDTIDFDAEGAATIDECVGRLGSDGKLLGANTKIHHVTFVEKLLTLSLAKLSNFVPDGGIWLNTQRPEWNDANNALVGNGLSMVTACYLHRWFKFLHHWLAANEGASFDVSEPVAMFFDQISQIMTQAVPADGHGANSRAKMVEALSIAGSEYRKTLYENGLGEETRSLDCDSCLKLFANALRHLESTIRNNHREDGLYHAYNLLSWDADGLEVEHLYEMLEGQVAVLSAGLLEPTEVVDVLDALRSSKLYRENQDSYLLYPDRQLPPFLEKNVVPEDAIAANPLLQQLLEDGNSKVIRQDIHGGVHFNGSFRNSADLRDAIQGLPAKYESLADAHGANAVAVFEDVFGHAQFTGRSGTFFGYEGLGSIYWHMVSKLVLAVGENHAAAVESGADADTIQLLREHYYSVRRGVGAEKSAAEYGAFPTDPYSHTPENAGVKQPGMTGQVKEDILSRFAELGVQVGGGELSFATNLFDRNELVSDRETLMFFGLRNDLEQVEVPQSGIGFTIFQVPVVYRSGSQDRVEVTFDDGEVRVFDGLKIDAATSAELFSRSGKVRLVKCTFASLA
jgi:hypothetical protein